MDYSARKLTHVGVWALEGSEISETEYLVSGSVRLQFSSVDGSDAGPSITVELAANSDPSASIADAEKILLAATLSLLGRSAKETAETTHSVLAQARQKAFVKPADKT
jgi:hypothetical protein